MNRIENLKYKQKSKKGKKKDKKKRLQLKQARAKRQEKQNQKKCSPSRSEKKIIAFSDVRKDISDCASYIIIHKDQLQKLIKDQQCSVCNRKELNADLFGSYGLAKKIKVTCEFCDTVISEIYSSLRIDNSPRKPFHVNKKIVEAIIFMGLGYAGLERLCMTMDMEIMSKTTFNSILQNLSPEFEKYKSEVLRLSREKVRQHYLNMYPALKNNSILDYFVSYDGTYQKRGFTSLYGIGIVIELYTGLVIDYVVLSKVCKQCSTNVNKLGEDSEQFQSWYSSHVQKGECQKNFEGSSTSMEMKAAEILWSRSVESSMARYTSMLSDGDAKTFSHLCTLQVYGPEVELQKEECINHVAKRLTTALQNLRKEWSIKGVTLGGRKAGALTDKVIADLASFYRNAIVQNAPHVQLMKSAIIATLEHYDSTDESPKHHLCPSGKNSWCWYNKAEAHGRTPPSHITQNPKINSAVIEKIRPVYERLANTDLLQRCVRGGTQNSNESLHHLIWNQCAKEKFQSKKKLEMAVVLAVSQFNMGCEAAISLKYSMQDEDQSLAVQKVAASRDEQRLRLSRNMADSTQKRALRKRRKAQAAKESKKRKTEGNGYAAGAF